MCIQFSSQSGWSGKTEKKLTGLLSQGFTLISKPKVSLQARTIRPWDCALKIERSASSVLKQEKYFPVIIDSKVFTAASAYFALGDPKNDKECYQEKADKKGSMSKAEAKRLSEQAEAVTEYYVKLLQGDDTDFVPFASAALFITSIIPAQVRFVYRRIFVFYNPSLVLLGHLREHVFWRTSNQRNARCLVMHA